MNNNNLEEEIDRIARDWATVDRNLTLTKAEIRRALKDVVNERNYRKIKKIKNLNNSIGWVCYECGCKANTLTCIRKYKDLPRQYSHTLSTGLMNHICDVCGKTTDVIPERDFYYPDFSLMTKTMKQWYDIFYKHGESIRDQLPKRKWVLEKEFWDFIKTNHRGLVDSTNE